MSNVPESASYDAGIYQLETVDEVLGGVNGKANAQAKGLANRTNWLKAQVDALNLLKGKGVAAFSIANSYVAGEIVDYQKSIYRANTTVTPGAWNASQWNKLLGTAAESELASVAPVMNGVAAVGVSTQLARQDHVHPADTGLEPAITGDVVTKFWSGTKTWRDLATDVRAAALTGLSTATSTVVAATDSILVAIGKLQAQVTLQAPLASPALTGVPTAPTAANGTSTTQIASTAFVQAQLAASSVPAASETVAGKVELATAAETTTGTDNTRAVHPAGLKVELDKKAPLASPALTGTPTAPTASPGTDTTQLANTAFVKAAVDDAPRVGVGQTWQDVGASRTVNVTYTNSTGRPIMVFAGSGSTISSVKQWVINGLPGIMFNHSGTQTGTSGAVSAIIPAGATYLMYSSNGNHGGWWELR